MSDKRTVGFGALCLGVGVILGSVIPWYVALCGGLLYIVLSFVVGVERA